MKRIIVICVTVMLLIALTACTGNTAVSNTGSEKSNGSLNRKHLKSALLTVAWNPDDWTFDALASHYKTLVRYINFEDKGTVLGYGCGTPFITKRSAYPEKAYKLGKSLQ